MREPMRGLLSNSWVIGIAVAIAIGYAVVRVAASIAGIVLDLVEGERTHGTFSAYGVSFGGLLASAATLLLVLAAGALALRRSRGGRVIRRALRSLITDSWVLGIAAAAALAYVSVTFVETLVAFLLQFGEGIPVVVEEPLPEDFFQPPYSFTAFGRWIFYGDLVRATVLFFVVVAAVAALVHLTRPQESDDAAD